MPAEKQFNPVTTFSWDINRAERCLQTRWLAPLLEQPLGRAWFLEQLSSPCTPQQARAAEAFHLCFPLRDVFTADYYQCRGTPHLEDQFIAYYNRLFGLPKDFGVQELWRTAPNGEIRHPAAGGRSGWYEQFLRERIPDPALYQLARDMRRTLGTEADALLLTSRHVVLIECKYQSGLSVEQYERQQKMGHTLAQRLEKEFYFGMVVKKERDSRHAHIQAPYVLWSAIETWLEEN